MELIRLIMAAISFLGVFLSSSNMIKFNAACNPRERESLINFKHNLIDPSNKLWSWFGKDCCKWYGVICKNNTESDGNDWILKLELGGNPLYSSMSGELNSSLLELKHLYHLDLSFNNFTGIQIPAFLGSLHNLQYLDLSGNQLEGEIPRTLGNLCNLEVLHLSGNKLQGEISSRLFRNSSRCFANKLRSLFLEDNLLSGRLPDELGSLKNLERLSLAGNSFSGSIPMSLGRLSLLRTLDLSENKLNGSFPESFRSLWSLEELLISDNILESVVVTEAHFANLTRLKVLQIDSLVLNVSLDWVPPFQLQRASMRNFSVGYRFPEWLRTQKDLQGIDISNSRLSGSVPSWFWNMTSQLYYLDISHNQLEGDLSNVLLKCHPIGLFYLNSNKFRGNLPLISSTVFKLNLSENYLSGPISALLCNPVEDNNSLMFLDLSENQLSGMLPDCWSPWRSLVGISFQSNKITGNVPRSIGFLKQLKVLQLQKNSLSGEFPSSLQNCTELRIIDLGENRLTGPLPKWIGESFKDTLVVLRLHSNKFHGEIPRELCHLIVLQIMDLGHNDLSGSIPKCFSNFSSMASNRFPSFRQYGNYSFLDVITKVEYMTKGINMRYDDSVINAFAGINLSNNKLYGKIPEELTYLFGLHSLNLANNSFTGRIPNKIGLLSSLESLDLSNNRLLGSIPQSMVNLTFLEYLNLSYNNLSGRIPSSTQLGTFSELSYTGNHDLCGFPLNKCDEDEQRQKAPNGDGDGEGSVDDEDWIEMKWFYMGLPFGFVVGFWCLWGVLLVKRSWRYVYFRFLDDIIYSLCTCLKQKKK